MAGVAQGLFLAAGLVLLTFPVDAGGNRGGSSASSRGSSGGGHSSAGSRGSSGGSRSSSAGPRSSSGGSRSASVSSRSSSGGGRTTTAAPRSGGGGRSTTSSSSPRGSYGDRGYTSSGSRSTPGTRTISATGTRGGQGGHPGGGGSGGGHTGGGRHGGGHGWYCPPTYHYGGSSWFWGGPWDWWWGWGPYWGVGPYWGWGGVYVINEVSPYADHYARIDTDVSPESAEVYLDGTLIGQADDFDGFPDYLYLETGKYRVEFRHPSYETVTKEIDVRAGQAIAMSDAMKLLPGKKKLEVVDPADIGTPFGRVFGNPEARRPETAEDRTGRFDMKAEPDGLEDPDDDVRPPVPPPLPAEPGVSSVPPAERSRLRFEVEPDDAAVYLDDRYVGTAEELAGLRRGFPVKPGKHAVTVVRPGYETKTVEVEVKPGVAIDVVVELEK